MRNKEAAQEATVYVNKISEGNNFKDNFERSSSSDLQEECDFALNVSKSGSTGTDNKTDRGRHGSTSSEVEGFLADDVFEYTCLNNDDANVEAIDELSDVVIEEAHLNRQSDRQETESVERYGQDADDNGTFCVPVEPPKKRGK